MNIAPPIISVDEWFDYMDGRADAGTRHRILTAVETHDPSRQIFEALKESSARLRQEALRIHRAFDLPERAVAAASVHVLDRVRSSQGRAAFAPARTRTPPTGFGLHSWSRLKR